MLDTNIIIYTLKNRPEKVKETFIKHDGQMSLSTITVGELFYGAERSNQPEQNMAVLEGMFARLEIIPFEQTDALHFGQVRADLYQQGKPIGPYDMMIAGHCRARGLILVTNNEKEFSRVSGLRIENWV